MHYFIDGYNLMFRILHADDDLQKQRQEIIQNLEAKISYLELDVTIVFDAQYQNTATSRSHLNRLEIFFTAVGETADEFILQSLKESTKSSQQTVVTSDKKLAWLSRRSHAKTESVETFINWLNRRYKNKLQQQKNKFKKSKELIHLLPSPKITPPKQAISPGPQSSPEDCFDFYLDRFEKEYSALVEEKTMAKEIKKSRNSETLRKKKRKSGIPPKKETLSDTERWRAAFERDEDIF